MPNQFLEGVYSTLSNNVERLSTKAEEYCMCFAMVSNSNSNLQWTKIKNWYKVCVCVGGGLKG